MGTELLNSYFASVFFFPTKDNGLQQGKDGIITPKIEIVVQIYSGPVENVVDLALDDLSSNPSSTTYCLCELGRHFPWEMSSFN